MGAYGSGRYGRGLYGFGGGGFPYVGLDPSFDLDNVINKIVMSGPAGDPQVAEDFDSQEKYFIRERQFTSLVSTEAEMLNQAQWKLGQFSEPLDRVDSIDGLPLVDLDDPDQIDAWVPREVGDRITLLETPPGFAAEQDDEYTIQYLAGGFDGKALTNMRLQFRLQPAATVSFWVAGDPVLSLAGVSTRVGY